MWDISRLLGVYDRVAGELISIGHSRVYDRTGQPKKIWSNLGFKTGRLGRVYDG